MNKLFTSILFFFFIFFFVQCESKLNNTNKKVLTDQYLESLEQETLIGTILFIDSILNNKNYNNSTLALLYFKKGKKYSQLQKDLKAIHTFEKALDIFKEINEDTYLVELYWLLGSSYAFLSDKVKATDYLLQATDANKLTKDNKLQANIYGSLSHVHFLYNDYEKAIEFTVKAIEIHSANKDTLNISATYNNLAVIYKNIEDYPNALKYNLASLKLNLILKDQNAIAKSYNNLGLVAEKMSSNEEAINYYQNAININTEIGNANSSAQRNLGKLYINTNNIAKSKKAYYDALDVEINSGKTNIQRDIYSNLLSISIKEGDFKNSLIYQKKRDSLNLKQTLKDNTTNVNSIEKQYQLVNKEQELNQERSINKKNKIIFATVSLVILLLTLFSVLFIKNRKLKYEKEKISMEQKVLRSQMNPHFIFNALSAIQNSLLDNDPLKSASYLSRFAKLIRQNFDFINEKSIILADELDALKNYMETQKMRFEDKFTYEINVFADIDINTVEIPPLLLQPFIENAIEHGFKNKKEKGKIVINISKKHNYVCYEIRDNGHGITTKIGDNKLHAIDIFKKRIKLFENNNEKTFSIKSDNKGTIVNFRIKG